MVLVGFLVCDSCVARGIALNEYDTMLYGGWGKAQSAGMRRGEGLGFEIAGE